MNEILVNLDGCVDTLIDGVDKGYGDCMAITIDGSHVLLVTKQSNVNACTCSSSCGSNYSQGGGCVCSSSCGSNYSRG